MRALTALAPVALTLAVSTAFPLAAHATHRAPTAEPAGIHRVEKVASVATSFDSAAWPEWNPRPDFVTWETLFAAASGKGPGRVARP